MPSHLVNWYGGWSLLLSAFITGAAGGLFFHRDDFLGGYGSFRRRIVRLGHIALAALGMVNVIYSLSPWPGDDFWEGRAAAFCFLIGGVTMPVVCFLTGWKTTFRHLFFVPVTILVLAVLFTLLGGY